MQRLKLLYTAEIDAESDLHTWWAVWYVQASDAEQIASRRVPPPAAVIQSVSNNTHINVSTSTLTASFWDACLGLRHPSLGFAHVTYLATSTVVFVLFVCVHQSVFVVVCCNVAMSQLRRTYAVVCSSVTVFVVVCCNVAMSQLRRTYAVVCEAEQRDDDAFDRVDADRRYDHIADTFNDPSTCTATVNMCDKCTPHMHEQKAAGQGAKHPEVESFSAPGRATDRANLYPLQYFQQSITIK